MNLFWCAAVISFSSRWSCLLDHLRSSQPAVCTPMVIQWTNWLIAILWACIQVHKPSTVWGIMAIKFVRWGMWWIVAPTCTLLANFWLLTQAHKTLMYVNYCLLSRFNDHAIHPMSSQAMSTHLVFMQMQKGAIVVSVCAWWTPGSTGNHQVRLNLTQDHQN